MGINYSTNIQILDFNLPVIGLVGILLGFAALLLFIYFVITFSLFQNKKRKQRKLNTLKMKEKASLKENIEDFEQEIMLAKKIGLKG
ncbi:hypothetical protein SSYRP_v1c03260 [Spiroplasma syrphidicola EA-1]|uniref:Uncharacterized protein n=1 Tax=Spiroplasma syrphidicola EA-1 TaxID=1276229 RepID=R4UID0_9MOLU|nr:hypothetical protein [Spiroplasma syrphidicola]AGM25920.1 hypothetical protein SSYRP_v1c03260 [Spiroplasma syrphidicola EA-1]